MKESQRYIKFFCRNIWILLVACVVGGCLGYLYQASQPVVYTTASLYSLDESRLVASEGVIKLDQAVAILRAEQMRRELGIDTKSQVIIFKNSPLTVSLAVANADERLSKIDLGRIESYLSTNFPVKQLGQAATQLGSRSSKLGGGVGIVVGLGCGLLIALLREYTTKY